eukprot:jgi/Chrzof1/14199/Cz08g29070.t1
MRLLDRLFRNRSDKFGVLRRDSIDLAKTRMSRTSLRSSLDSADFSVNTTAESNLVPREDSIVLARRRLSKEYSSSRLASVNKSPSYSVEGSEPPSGCSTCAAMHASHMGSFSIGPAGRLSSTHPVY